MRVLRDSRNEVKRKQYRSYDVLQITLKTWLNININRGMYEIRQWKTIFEKIRMASDIYADM